MKEEIKRGIATDPIDVKTIIKYYEWVYAENFTIQMQWNIPSKTQTTKAASRINT